MAASRKPLNVLVTGIGGPAGVNAATLLRRQHSVRIFGTDMSQHAAGRHLADHFETMAPASDKTAYYADLRAVTERWEIDLLIPTVQEELVLIPDVVQSLSACVFISQTAALSVGNDKREMYAWAERQVPDLVPRWQTADKPLDFIADSYFLKPAFGRGGRGVRTVGTEEASRLKDELERPDEWLLMEYLPGKEWTVDSYRDRTGRCRFVIPRERLVMDGGISVKGRTVRCQPLIDSTTQLIHALKVVGHTFVQWKAGTDGVPHFVEINLRLSGGLLITAAAGGDPIDLMLKEVRGEPIEDVDWREITVSRSWKDEVA